MRCFKQVKRPVLLLHESVEGRTMDYIEGKLLISEEIYNKMLAKISEGFWKEGDRLPSESQLCKLYNASRGSVRSALQKLQARGLIVTRQGVGSVVTMPPENSLRPISLVKSDITETAFTQFTEFRLALEFKAVDLLIAEQSPGALEQLEAAVFAFEQCRGDDPKELAACDFNFHKALFENCGNPYIRQTFELYREVYYHYVEEVHRVIPPVIDQIKKDHRELFKAIRDRRGDQYRKIILEDMVIFQKRAFKD